ncbi:MAG: sigma-70 family RNA polymerase sigma factor [bacterium]|nr:sigma-70 family RNA polymerase sigma factor [bacterium]
MPDTNPQSGSDVFEILARAHADMLIAYLRSIVRDQSGVDDLFQETMIVAWRRLGEFDRSRPFGPWLRGIASNLAMASFRKGKSRPLCVDPEVLAAISDRYGRLERTAGDSFRSHLTSLADCMSRLPGAMREAVELAYGRGMLLKHITESRGEMEETVKKRVQRARQALAACLAGTAAGAGSNSGEAE